MPDGQQPWPNLTSEEHASLIQQFQDACPGGVDEEQHELSKTNVRPPHPCTAAPCPLGPLMPARCRARRRSTSCCRS